MTGRQDNLGNRATAMHNGNTATYTANALNQYTQRSCPWVNPSSQKKGVKGQKKGSRLES